MKDMYKRIAVVLSSAVLGLLSATAGADPSHEPLYLKQGAVPNVLLNMSVETPMGGAAYPDQVGVPDSSCAGRVTFNDGAGNQSYGACYVREYRYHGYFDPKKCYNYNSGSTRFDPVALTTDRYDNDYNCGGRWSGNWLNWTSMTAIDMFIKTMSGGNRVEDTTSGTVIQRARKTDNNTWFPYKLTRATDNVAPNTVTPFTNTHVIVYNTTWGFKVATTRILASAVATTEYRARAQVCQLNGSTANLEDNCIAYGSGTPYYKPEGLMQRNAEKMRFALTSYTTDAAQNRDGGVLRSNAKYVGPRMLDSTGTWVANPNKEWGTDGLYIGNPDGVGGGLNSGVLNYLNKFSDSAYKSFDPIGELLYESIRYFKHVGPTPEYTAGITRDSSDARCGGFWFANSSAEWQDPYQYPCQKGFIIGINDANPWLDKRLPGTFFNAGNVTSFSPAKVVTRCDLTTVNVSAVWNVSTGQCASAAANLDSPTCATRETVINNCQVLALDYGEPSNADPDINVHALTNTVGSLEGLNGTSWSSTGTWTSAGSSGSVSGTWDSVGGSVGPGGNFDRTCSTKTMSALGEVLGTCPSPGKQNAYHIAGLAYYANTTDLRPDLIDDYGDQKVSSFFIDTQEFSTNPLDGPRNMLWLAGKYGGFIDTNGNNAPDLAEEWDEDGDGLPDNFVLATDPNKLVSGLEEAFDDVISRTSTATALVATSGRITEDLRLFQAMFDTSNWSGRLLAYSLNADGTVNQTEWDTDGPPDPFPAPNLRDIYTWNPLDQSGAEFRWTGTDVLNSTQKAALNDDSTLLDYLRGDATNEKTALNPSGTFRERSKLLGDVVNSSPVYVGASNFGYEVLPQTDGGADVYKTFRVGNRTRTRMVYVGANDGMLHGFDADSGDEKFAYVPNAAFGNNLKVLADVRYTHRAFVDGPANFTDAYIGGAWSTILVGSMGSGGKSVFALDVTDPNDLSGVGGVSKVLWEFDSSIASDLGYTLQKPVLARMQNGRWAAIFGNGYNSATGTAKLFIVFLDPDLSVVDASNPGGWTLGEDYLVLSTNSTTGNGMSGPAVLLDGRATARAIYAGDLQGNLWKFDVSDTDPDNWVVSYTDSGVNVPLFAAVDPSGNAQPITAPPRIGLHSRGGYMLYFGTGKYYEDGDQTNLQVQSFYGIWDKPDNTRITYSTRSDVLREMQILEENSTDGVRVTSSVDDGDYYGGVSPKRGWFMDLKVLGASAKGERVFSRANLLDDRVIFVTVEPSTDPCLAGGNSWIMEVNAQSGSRPAVSVFDLNNDNKFNVDDEVAMADGSKHPASGMKVEGVLPGLTLLTGGQSDDVPASQTAFKMGNTSAGGELVSIKNRGPMQPRASWRQLN